MREQFEGRKNPEEEQRLVQQIFDRARELVEGFGKDVDPEIFGKQMPAKFVELDVPDKKDLRRATRVLVFGDSGNKVVVVYNHIYTKGITLHTEVRMDSTSVISFQTSTLQHDGDSTFASSPLKPSVEQREFLERFHPTEKLHGELDLNKILRFLNEGKVIEKSKKNSGTGIGSILAALKGKIVHK